MNNNSNSEKPSIGVILEMFGSKKKKDASITELSNLVAYIENNHNPILTSKTVDAYSHLRKFQGKYFKDGEPITRGKKRAKGMSMYINHSLESELEINGGSAIYLKPEDQYNTSDKKGQQFLEEILTGEHHDGAVEITPEGFINSYQRKFALRHEDVAIELGLATNKRNVPYQLWNFMKEVSERHTSAIASSYKDPNAYFMTFSEQTGDIRVYKAGDIILSTGAPQEIPLKYSIFLSSLFKNGKQSSTRSLFRGYQNSEPQELEPAPVIPLSPPSETPPPQKLPMYVF